MIAFGFGVVAGLVIGAIACWVLICCSISSGMRW